MVVTENKYADDDDSVFLQSSSKTPCKKLQRSWRFLGVKHKSECIPAEIEKWLAQTAGAKMAKAGPIEEIPPGKKEICGFRRAHASEIFIFPASHISLSTRF